MKKTPQLSLLVSALCLNTVYSYTIDSQEELTAAIEANTSVEIKDGQISPNGKTASFKSKIQRFNEKKSLQSITISQSTQWLNWNPIPNLGPQNLNDSPIFLQLGPDNYWMFGRYGQLKPAGKTSKTNKGKNQGTDRKPAKQFEAKETTLEGFDIPLKTTPSPNQFDAIGGLEKPIGGYHAWQSRDMKNWVHHGPISEKRSRWMTNAEYVDGKVYFYYDFPNDQDPHVIVDSNLFDGKMGDDKGMAIKDPSHGSDCGVIRDLEGNFHVILENWDPIKASTRSWDSPLASHAISANGIDNFKIVNQPAVDERTKPTGKMDTYNHPHWVSEDPANYKTRVAQYEIHEPEQEAYGDWAAISIGGQYYLFGDYDPAGAHGKDAMSVCWFTSDSINNPFTFCSHIGKGHPDPDVIFAEDQFYLATQMKTDYVSPGPWVESVEVRVGVDTDNDQKIDQWSEWQEVKESYDYIKGFAKQVAKTPASLDLSALPAGHGFQYEVKLTDTTENPSAPVIDKIELSFGE